MEKWGPRIGGTLWFAFFVTSYLSYAGLLDVALDVLQSAAAFWVPPILIVFGWASAWVAAAYVLVWLRGALE